VVILYLKNLARTTVHLTQLTSTGTSSRFIQWFFHVKFPDEIIHTKQAKQARQELKIPMKQDRPSKKHNTVEIEHCID